jgi:oxygen-dependent protoporphyrinogen oxidase
MRILRDVAGPRILVVGAGVAGLACAFRLQRAGFEVVVLEREAVPGGRMRSEVVDGFVLDRGAQFVASGYRNLHALARTLGIADRVRPVRRASNAILRGGVLHPGDYGSPGAFARSRLLSAGAKLRLVRLLLDLWRHRAVLDPLRPERAAALDRDDLATYLRRTVGDEAFEYLLAPAFSSTFDSEPEDLSGAFALLTLRFVLGGFRLQSFAEGIGLLTRTLAERVPVRCGVEVGAVEPHEGGVQVRARGAAGEERLEAAAAVVAVPGSLVPRLCPKLAPGERAFFEGVRYVRGTIVFLLLERAPETLPGYGVAFPRREGLGLYGMAVDHHKEGVAPPGAGLVNVALSAASAERLWHAPDAEVAGFVLDALARTPVGRLHPLRSVVYRFDPMLPQFRAGLLPRLAAFLERPERSPRLAFAGDYLVGPYTEAALASGLRAATEIGRMLP